MDHAAATPPPPATAPLGPVGEGERLVTIDVLRGIALLGILVVNMPFFAMPMMDAVGLGHAALADGPLSERLAWAFVKAFGEMKFISMFSMLFGIGLIIQAQRAEARGRSFAPVYLRRLGVLALFGLAHAFLLWYGDILLIYAVVGTLLLLARRWRPRTLLKVAAACIAVNIFFSITCPGLMLIGKHFEAAATETEVAATVEVTEAEDEAGAEESGPTELASLNAMMRAEFDPSSPAWIEGERSAYREGPFVDAFLFRAASYAFAVIGAVFGYGWRVIAMFLVGAALMKLEFFRPERRAWQKRMCIIGLGVGVPLELAVAGTWMAVDFEISWPMLVAAPVHELAAFAQCLGYVGAVCLLVRPGPGGLVSRLFASAGRLALSVYLLETIITTTIMYWWGLGRFDDFSRLQLLLVTASIYAGLLVGATVWLRFFTIGPFEWLWRSLIYLRPQPMVRRSARS
jgi:uncharacterized protein